MSAWEPLGSGNRQREMINNQSGKWSELRSVLLWESPSVGLSLQFHHFIGNNSRIIQVRDDCSLTCTPLLEGPWVLHSALACAQWSQDLVPSVCVTLCPNPTWPLSYRVDSCPTAFLDIPQCAPKTWPDLNAWARTFLQHFLPGHPSNKWHNHFLISTLETGFHFEASPSGLAPGSQCPINHTSCCFLVQPPRGSLFP